MHSNKDLKNMAYIKLWRQKKISEQQFWEVVVINKKKSAKRALKYIKKLMRIMKEENI